MNPSGSRAQYVLVSDACADAGLVFSLGTNTAPTVPTAPTDNYSGASTSLDAPYNAFVDNSGNEWFSNYTGASVTYTAVNKNGNAAPTKKLSGATTTLSGPTGIYVDQASGVNRYLYVADYSVNKIDIFQVSLMSGSSPDIAPTWTISGGTTGLSRPEALTLDSSGNIWVANYGGKDILEFSNPTGGAPGNYSGSPIETLGGATSTLVGPLGLALDRSGKIWIGDYSNEIDEFSASSGAGVIDPAPYLTISNGAISEPYGVAVDSGGNVYEVGYAAPTLNMWTASSLKAGSNTGAPSYVVSGASSKLDCPAGLQAYSTSGTTDV